MNKITKIFKGDKVVWMILFFLCLISIIEVFSASSFLTYKGGNYWGPIIKHTFYIFVGISSTVVFLNIPCRFFKAAAFPMLFLSVLLLFGVLIIGQATNGASRWIDLGLFQFQPSELGKGTLVLVVAQLLAAMQTENGASRQAFWWVLGTSAFIIVPIFFENFSTAALIFAVVFLMMFIGRVPYDMLGKLMGVLLILAIGAVALVMALGQETKQTTDAEVMSKQTVMVESAPMAPDTEIQKRGGLMHRMDTWKSRIMKYMNSEEVLPDKYDLDKDAQVAHANIAIVKSNFVGRGPGKSEERDFLSQAFSDFIFAIIIEETGILGAAFVAFLYVILFWRAGRIARECANAYPAFLAMGIGLLLVIQAMFNMMVAVGIVPVTGQPLPLISKGGTSTIINCVYIGILLSVSKTAKKKPEYAVARNKK